MSKTKTDFFGAQAETKSGQIVGPIERGWFVAVLGANSRGLFTGVVVPNWLMEREEISAGAKLCFAFLAYQDKKDNNSIEEISKKIGTTPKQTKRYLNELSKLGLLK